MKRAITCEHCGATLTYSSPIQVEGYDCPCCGARCTPAKAELRMEDAALSKEAIAASRDGLEAEVARSRECFAAIADALEAFNDDKVRR